MWGAEEINLIFNHSFSKLSPMMLHSLTGKMLVTGCCNLGRLSSIVVISTKPITNNYVNAFRINKPVTSWSMGNSIKSSFFRAFLTLSSWKDVWETSTPEWPLNVNMYDRTALSFIVLGNPTDFIQKQLFFSFWRAGINKGVWYIHHNSKRNYYSAREH